VPCFRRAIPFEAHVLASRRPWDTLSAGSFALERGRSFGRLGLREATSWKTWNKWAFLKSSGYRAGSSTKRPTATRTSALASWPGEKPRLR